MDPSASPNPGQPPPPPAARRLPVEPTVSRPGSDTDFVRVHSTAAGGTDGATVASGGNGHGSGVSSPGYNGNGVNGNGHGGGGYGGKRGPSAAEALAAELHREIHRREELERRLNEAETRLAQSASPPASAPSPAALMDRTSSPEAGERKELEARLVRTEARLAQTEARLAGSEQRLAYMMTSSPLGFFDRDRAAGTAYYSPGYKEMLGYRADELPDTLETFRSLLHPEDANRDWLAEREPVGDGINRFTRYFRLRHKDGHYLWIESTGMEFSDREGRTVRSLGFHRDITERKNLEERLHQSEERFNLLVTSSPLGFLRHGPGDGPLILFGAVEEHARLPARGTARHAQHLDGPRPPGRARRDDRRAHRAVVRREPPVVLARGADAPQGRWVPLGAGERDRLLRGGRAAAARARVPRGHPRAQDGRGSAGARKGVPGRDAGLHLRRRHHDGRRGARDVPERRRRDAVRVACPRRAGIAD